MRVHRQDAAKHGCRQRNYHKRTRSQHIRSLKLSLTHVLALPNCVFVVVHTVCADGCVLAVGKVLSGQ